MRISISAHAFFTCTNFSNGSRDPLVFLFKQGMRHVFIRFVGVVPYFNESANKLAVSDGWAQIGDGWANACPSPPTLATQGL